MTQHLNVLHGIHDRESLVRQSEKKENKGEGKELSFVDGRSTDHKANSPSFASLSTRCAL
jgi:hypothetical protein